jgi:exosortase A-associated hydrolase 2
MAWPPMEASFRAMPHGGSRLWLWHTPPEGVARRGAMLYAHPFAEEMNKSRRMAALAARELAADGWCVLQPDLAGCGESSGSLEDARVDTWLHDLEQAALALRAQQPGGPLWLWGLRAGALWSCALASRLAHEAHLLLWQPAIQGKALLQQFLRLKAASQLAEGHAKPVMDALRADLAAGRPVDIAGYRLGAALAAGLEAATLGPPRLEPGQTRRMVWIEVAAAGAELSASPATRAAWPKWQQAGWQVDGLAVAGPAFWQTTEIEDAPALVQATVSALRGAPVTA